MKNPYVVLSIMETIPAMGDGLKRLEKRMGYPLKGVTLVDKSQKDNASRRKNELFNEMYVDFNDPIDIQSAVKTFKDDLLLATCRGDPNIPYFAKIIPFIPYIGVPTVASVTWSTNKISMRDRFTIEDPSITPEYKIITNDSGETMNSLEENVGYPMMIKPAKLMSSLLIQECPDRESLKNTLKNVFEQIQAVHDRVGRKDSPEVVVEQRMIGPLYSIDSYVDNKGKVYHCPPCGYVDGKQAGYSDFFLYNRTTPAVSLSDEDVTNAETVTEKGIHAMGLKNTTCHSELILTGTGWKIIEIGPRIGRYRDKMYELGYGIDHTLNDMLNRMSIEPEIPTQTKKHVAAFSFYPKTEGLLKEIEGIEKVKTLKSVHEVKIYKEPGYNAKFASNGGEEIVSVMLANQDPIKLKDDITIMEKNLKLII